MAYALPFGFAAPVQMPPLAHYAKLAFGLHAPFSTPLPTVA
jgi:hypothetical protein